MNLGGAVRVNKTGFIIVIFLLILIIYYYSNNNNDDTSKLNNIKNSGGISLRTLLSYSIKASKYGGIEVVQARNNLVIKSKGKTKEGANDSYTTADINSHCSMTMLLNKKFPNVKLISEEHNVNCDKEVHFDGTNLNDAFEFSDVYVDEKDVTIWIDPLDATQEYMEQLYQYVTTMVCVAVKGRPTIGVIHNPFSNETYWAWIDKEMSSNLQKNTGVDHGEETVVFISRSHAGKMQEVIKKNFPNDKMNIIEAGGAGYKVIQVATGKGDVYLHITHIKKWDICAGDAILRALGGKLTTKNDVNIDYADTNPVNMDGVIASLKKYDKFVGKI